MKTSLTIATVCSTFLYVTLNTAVADDYTKHNWISGGAVATSLSGSVALVEIERLWTKAFSTGLRFAATSYEYDDGSYHEEGDETGLEVTFRFYPERVGFQGFYWGAAVGIWKTDYDWRDPNDTPMSGSDSTTSLNLNAMLGWKLRFGDGTRFFADPQVGVGVHTQAGLYAFGGIQIGTRF